MDLGGGARMRRRCLKEWALRAWGTVTEEEEAVWGVAGVGGRCPEEEAVRALGGGAQRNRRWDLGARCPEERTVPGLASQKPPGLGITA